MLKVGINDNLTLSKVEVTEKEGKLSVDFQFGSGGAAADALNPFSTAVDEHGFASTGSNANGIKVWPPSPADPKKFDGTARTKEEIAQDTMKSVLELKNLLQQFALCFTTSDKINLNDYKRGTPVTIENWMTTIPTEAVLNTITRNFVTDFNKAVGEFLGKNDPQFKLRVICCRQSAAKHYASFRKNFIAENPVVENAQIPIASTKLKFTKYEIEKGLNKDGAVEANPDSTPESDLTEASVFSQQ